MRNGYNIVAVTAAGRRAIYEVLNTSYIEVGYDRSI